MLLPLLQGIPNEKHEYTYNIADNYFILFSY